MPPQPARFVRLRIAGFKSFAEPSGVDILPGLTGIVGPNGCGKSNVVEALRWAMGETSARALRGGEMDDVIFAGTASRSARNLAEVTITLEGAAGLAPQPFHDADELQITRRIERGAGSAYRINGRDARARDVQTLFADLASGARSSAMVSQGRVSALVNARPEERRAILEEAAGITGLHARRHEAELKLRAAEANMGRAEDVRVGLETRLGTLSQQAQQAQRYRVVASGLREAETTLEALIHARAHEAVRRGGEALTRLQAAREEAEAAAERAHAAETQATDALPPLREAEAEARTRRERRHIALEALAEAAARDEATLAAERDRLAQAIADHDAARARRDEARETLAAIDAELAEIDARLEALPDALATAEAALAKARETETHAAEAARAATARQTQAEDAARDAAARRDAAREALERLAARLAALESDIAGAEQATPDADARHAARRDAAEAETALAAARVALEQAGAARDAAATAQGEARERLAEATRHARALRQQHEGLRARAARLAETDATLTRQQDAAKAQLTPKDAEAAAAVVTRLEAEAEQARQALADATNARAAAAAATAETRAKALAARAERERLQAALGTARTRAERLSGLHAGLARDHAAARDALPDPALLARATAARDVGEQTLTVAVAALDAAEIDARTRSETARTDAAAHHAAATALAGLHAQIDGLAGGLSGEAADPKAGTSEPVAALLSVPEGLEAALAAALGDGLEAPLQARADGPYWQVSNPTTDALTPPQGTQGLAALIGGRAAIGNWAAQVLGGVGLLADGADGAAAQAALRPGQMLVSRAGGLWRWDGYVRPPGHDPAAERLAQRARLTRLRMEAETAATALPALETAAKTARAAAEAAEATLRAARSARDTAEREAATARATLARHEAETATRQSRLDALTPQLAQLVEERDEARAAFTQAEAAHRDAPDEAAARASADQARQAEQQAEAAERHAREASRALETKLAEGRRSSSAAAAKLAEAESRLASLAPQHEQVRSEAAELTSTIAALDAEIGALPDLDALTRAAATADAGRTTAEAALESANRAREAAEAARTRTANAAAALDSTAETQAARLEALSPQVAALREDHASATTHLAGLEAACAALPNPATLAEARDAAIAAAETATEAATAARAEHDTLAREAHARGARRDGLRGDRGRWAGQLAAGDAAASGLEERRTTLEAAVAEASKAPQANRDRDEQARIEAGAAENLWMSAQAELAEAERALAAAQGQARAAVAAASGAREAAGRAETQNVQATEALAALLDAAAQENRTLPDFVPDDLSDNAEAGLRRKVARLIRERDEIGPVNLRAEIEAKALEEEAGTLLREREELESAIARLRGTIGNLNREGRERLTVVFRQVDAQFQTLFARMFGGGRAHLGMVGSDDPLEAGLEIYAQPPGKKLATLSLLSGGEQALTALSLIFAVFGCNPAPVCVLDEVDAPLDDANVQRFATLLADMVAQTGTRFLVVTHHQLTMAHMDRLYGVTMQERGVSRLLSVDLQAASAMVEGGSPL